MDMSRKKRDLQYNLSMGSEDLKGQCHENFVLTETVGGLD